MCAFFIAEVLHPVICPEAMLMYYKEAGIHIDPNVINRMAARQTMGLKRLVSASDYLQLLCVYLDNSAVASCLFITFLCVLEAVCLEVSHVRLLISWSRSSQSRWPVIQELKEVYIATRRP
jgi:hypothetical protein